MYIIIYIILPLKQIRFMYIHVHIHVYTIVTIIWGRGISKFSTICVKPAVYIYICIYMYVFIIMWYSMEQMCSQRQFSMWLGPIYGMPKQGTTSALYKLYNTEPFQTRFGVSSHKTLFNFVEILINYSSKTRYNNYIDIHV